MQGSADCEHTETSPGFARAGLEEPWSRGRTDIQRERPRQAESPRAWPSTLPAAPFVPKATMVVARASPFSLGRIRTRPPDYMCHFICPVMGEFMFPDTHESIFPDAFKVYAAGHVPGAHGIGSEEDSSPERTYLGAPGGNGSIGISRQTHYGESSTTAKPEKQEKYGARLAARQWPGIVLRTSQPTGWRRRRPPFARP